MLRILFASGFVSVLALGCAVAPERSSVSRVLGAPAQLGNGTVTSYAEFDASGAPRAIGVLFTASALEGLPTTQSGGRHCFDADKDGAIDPMTECAGWHERVLPLPSEASRRKEIPFKWVLLNWNAHGHIPPGIYDKPHFDVHFYIQPMEDVFAIERGTCGPERVRCDQFAEARRPVPPQYMHADFRDVEAVAPAMGNHLVDLTSPEFKGVPFTRTWIYGAYGGHVTFYEEMVTLEYMRSADDKCFPIKTTSAVAQTGYYPTKSCIRQVKNMREISVSMEDFKLRQASSGK